MSPAFSTYLYDLSLSQDSIAFGDNRPIVGVARTASGYSLCQVFVDEKCILLKDQLTEEALRAVVQGDGYMEPLYVCGGGGPWTPPILLRGDHVEAITVSRPLEPSTLCNHILSKVGRRLAIDTSDFRVVNRTAQGAPRPIYLSTAQQIGLLANDNIPPLVTHLLPVQHRSPCAKLLKRYLLSPPPHAIADSLRTVLGLLVGHPPGGEGGTDGVGVPSLPAVQPVSVGKVISLLSSGQCNAATFREIENTLSGIQKLLELSSSEKACGRGGVSELVGRLLELGAYESGVAIDPSQFSRNIRSACSIIRENIAVRDLAASESASRDPFGRVPDDFFDRNELDFRGTLVTGLHANVISRLLIGTWHGRCERYS